MTNQIKEDFLENCDPLNQIGTKSPLGILSYCICDAQKYEN